MPRAGTREAVGGQQKAAGRRREEGMGDRASNLASVRLSFFAPFSVFRGQSGPTMSRTASALLALTYAIAALAARAEDWPGFRGPRGDGSSTEKGLPIRWSGTENVAWKVPVPGRGHASPAVFGDRIFLISALEEQQERILLCLDRRTGKTLWQRTVLKAPLERIHELNSYASSTPLADAKHVYVSFLDRDRMFLAAYTHAGEKVWEARPGPFSSMHGYCSSPVPYKNTIIVNGDHDGNGFLVALNRDTGQTVWKTARPNNTRSYCTPIIREIDGKPHMMLTGTKCVASYNPDDGTLQWIMDGPTEQFVAAPVYDGKHLFITAGYPDKHVLAINPRGTGKLPETNITWRTRRGAAYVPSPILSGKYLLVVSDGGFLSCWVADTGEQLWTERLGSGHSASPISAEDRVYFQSDRGVTTVLKPGSTFEKLAVNELGEDSFASPVPSQGQIFLRGVKHLFAIGRGREQSPVRRLRGCSSPQKTTGWTRRTQKGDSCVSEATLLLHARHRAALSSFATGSTATRHTSGACFGSGSRRSMTTGERRRGVISSRFRRPSSIRRRIVRSPPSSCRIGADMIGGRPSVCPTASSRCAGVSWLSWSPSGENSFRARPASSALHSRNRLRWLAISIAPGSRALQPSAPNCSSSARERRRETSASVST